MAATWYRSKWFLALVAVVALMVVALLVTPLLLDVDRYRPAIVEQIAKETGRDVEIERLRLTFLPSLELQVVNLAVRNPRGFPEGNTLAVERVDVGLAFWPLLHREVEVTSVTIQQPRLNLLSNETGQTNYELLLQPRRRATAAKKSGTEAAPPVTLTRIESVAVRDASVTSGSFWQGSKKVYPAWAVRGVSTEVRGIDLNDPQWLKRIAAELDLSAIEISSPSLKQPLRFTDGNLAVKDGGASGEFAIALGRQKASGTVKVASLEKPVADFTLSAGELNAADVTAAVGSGAQGGPSGGGRSQLLARGTVKVGKLIVAPLTAQNLDANVRLYGNRLEADPFSVEFYGGRARGNLGVDLASEALPAALAAKVEGVDVARAVAALNPGGRKGITGTFETDARLNLPLGAADPLAGLGGEGTFAVRNGTLPGVNLEGTLAKMPRFMQMSVPSGDTRFRFFGGDFRVVKQRFQSQSLKLDAETLEATLSGSSGFDQTLDYTGSGVLTGKDGGQQQTQQQSKNPLGGVGRVFGQVMQQTIGRMRVPFAVRGTFQNPQFVLAGTPAPVR